MSLLPWDTRRNLEDSLADFLQDEVTTQDITVIDEKGNEIAPQIRVGWKKTDDWRLPVISVYVDSRVAPRLSVGSNKREKTFLMIIDIRAGDVGSQLDLSTWVTDTINDGWTFFEWSANPADPDNPTKVQTGFVSFDFISDVAIRFGENVDLFDKYRQNITISTYIAITT